MNARVEEVATTQATGKRHISSGATLFALVGRLLRLQFRGAVIWGVALGALIALTVASFPSIEEQAQQWNELMKAYPPEVRELFGITDLSTIEGFLASNLFNFLVPLALAFFPILAGAGAIAGAEERGTLDVLLSNPLPRWQLVVGSFIATVLLLAVIIGVLWICTWVPAILLDVDLSAGRAAEAVSNLWPLCASVGALAMLCSATFHRRLFAIAIPGAVLIAMYLVDTLGAVVESLEGLQRSTVFYHYGSAIEEGIDWSAFIGISACAFLLVLIAVLPFQRRDIYT